MLLKWYICIELQKQATMNSRISRKPVSGTTNLVELSIENKRFVLEALNVKVLIDEDNVKMEDIIPLNHGRGGFPMVPRLFVNVACTVSDHLVYCGDNTPIHVPLSPP